MKRKFLVRIMLCCLICFGIVMPSALAAEKGETNVVEKMKGFSPPKGTIASSGNQYSTYDPKYAIDGNLGTKWWSRGFTDYIQLNFPNPTEFSFVQIAGYASPISNTTYTLYGLQNGTWKAISPKETIYLRSEVTITDPIEVATGAYEGLKIEANGGASWVNIHEITLGLTNTTDNSSIDMKAVPGDSQVTLKWDEVKGAENYTVKYGTESGKYTETATVTKDAYGDFVIPGLTNGTKYYFVVSAKVNGVDSKYSNEASATPQGGNQSEQPSGDRAILVVTMDNGLDKEFDLSKKELNAFIAWYDAKDAGRGASFFAIDKHSNNKGPFSNRKDYVIFNKILTFDVSEYSK